MISFKKIFKLSPALAIAALFVGVIIGTLSVGQAQAFIFGSEGLVPQWIRSGTTLILRTETDNVRAGSTGALFINTTGEKVGIGSISPTYDLSFGGNVARELWLERHTTADTAGNNFTIQSGGATALATNKNGGDLYLDGGVSTGSGTSNVYIRNFPGAAAATADNTVQTVASFLGTGQITFPLAVSSAASLNIGADVDLYRSAANVLTLGSGDSLNFLDNNALKFGTGLDSSIYYDGTDMKINPKLVGAGDLALLGDLRFENANPTIKQSTSLNDWVLSMNGSGGAINTASFDGCNQTNFSIVIRFKPNTPLVNATNFVLLDNYSGSGTDRLYASKDISNRAQISLTLGGVTNTLIASAANTLLYWNEYGWNEYKIIYRSAGGANAQELYLNGVQVATNTNAFTPAAISKLYFSGFNNRTVKLNGFIDYIRWYSDATQTTLIHNWEFSNNYTDTTGGFNMTADGTGNAFVDQGTYQRMTSNFQTTWKSPMLAGDLYTDYIFDTLNTRTAGNLFSIRNNNVDKVSLAYTGLMTFNGNSIAATATDKISLSNTTSATNGAQQYSPALYFLGNVWSTAGSSKAAEIRIYELPTQNATTPRTGLEIDGRIAGDFWGALASFERDSAAIYATFNGKVSLPSAVSSTVTLNIGADVDLYRSAANTLTLATGDTLIAGNITSSLDAGSGTLKFPNGAALPATCVAGQTFYDTDSDDCANTAAGDGAVCFCKTANVWVLLNNI